MFASLKAAKSEFRFFKENYEPALSDYNILGNLISKSLEIKKYYIEIDEFDQNERQVFNYGHSFGHAIESLTNYSIPHGIAVSFGMDMSNFISFKKGYIDESVRNNSRVLFEKIWHGYEDKVKGLDIGLFLVALSKDKKNVGNKLGLILNKGYGNIFKTLVDADENFILWLTEYFANETN